MIIDAHNHILGQGEYPGFTNFMKEMCLGYLRAQDKLPTTRTPTDRDWEPYKSVWQAIDPEKCIKDHEGIDKIVILGIAPSTYTAYGVRGTLDPSGVTGIPKPASIEKTNDYIAGLVARHPDVFIGFAAVNPLFPYSHTHQTPKAAVNELERAITKLKLQGLKLYPTYDHYSPDDRELAFPVFEKAEELGIPVLVHQASAPVVDAPLKYSFPHLLDEVGREFRNLKLIVAHMGFPWFDECIVLVAKHPNFYADLSFTTSMLNQEEMLRLLHRCKAFGLPLSKIFWATDYPGFESPKELLRRFRTLNEEAERLNLAKIPEKDLEGMLGENFARLVL